MFSREPAAAAWAGIHPRDVSACARIARLGSRGAQHDKFETLFGEIDFSELINWPTTSALFFVDFTGEQMVDSYIRP